MTTVRRTALWLVPLVLFVLAIVVWLLLIGMPFGGREEQRVEPTDVETETVAEGTAPAAPAAEVGTIVDLTDTTPSAPPPTETTATTDTIPQREITDAEATAVLRGAITSVRYYPDAGPECIELRSLGYENAGYTFSVWDACVPGGGSRLLGRWRVDSRTREVFRQREDGRFLRP